MICAKGFLDFAKGASQSIAPSLTFQYISLPQMEILAIIIDLVSPLRIQDFFCFKYISAKARDEMHERNSGFLRRDLIIMKIILGNAHLLSILHRGYRNRDLVI